MSNTLSAITTEVAKVALPVMQNALAPAAAFCSVIPCEDAPGRNREVPIIVSVPATTTNTTSFAPGDCVIDRVGPELTRYTQLFGVSNADVQNGGLLSWLVRSNAEAFANTLADAIMAVASEDNFEVGASSLPDTYGESDYDKLFGSIASNNRSILLDTPFFAKTKARWLQPGFNRVYEHSRWSTAGANISGLVADPRAIALCAGLPLPFDTAGRTGYERQAVTIPGLQLPVEFALWPLVGSRGLGASFDVFIGPKPHDTTALKLLKSVS